MFMVTTWVRIFFSSLFFMGTTTFAAASTAEQTYTADELLAVMTLEQKVGQILQGEIQSLSASEMRRYGIGSVLNGGGSYPAKNKSAELDDWLALADKYHGAAVMLSNGAAIAPIWGTDAVHGHNNVSGATLFPHNIGLGAADDADLVEAIARATAVEVKATGIDWVFAPTVAVAQDYRWGRTYESFGHDSKRVSALGAAVVRGFEAEGIATTAKHFLGDGGTIAGIDQGNFIGTLDALRTPHLAAYDGVFALDVPSIMSSFNSWNGQKVHGDERLLKTLLRDELGYQGLIVSDWNGIGQVAGCTNSSCAQAFNAGLDMIMAPSDWRALRKSILDQISVGTIPLSRLDEAVKRVIEFKMRYGLINSALPSSRVDTALRQRFGSEEHGDIARQAVRQSLVLLKNNDKTLPISGSSRIAVVGSGANNIAMQSGGWTLTWQGTENSNRDFPNASSIVDGFRERVASAGGTVVDDSSEKNVDVAVVVFGETPYAEGAGDLQNLVFKDGEHDDLELMRAYRELGVPVVAVFLTGRPLWVNREINASDAFVVAWLPGSEGGGVADVLVGSKKAEPIVDFTGTLPFPWPNLDLNKIDKRLPVDEYLWEAGYGLTLKATQETADLSEEYLSGNLKGQDVVVFRKNSVPPWTMFVGDEGQWVMPVSGAYARSSLEELVVKSLDVRVQEDARQITWSGNGARDSQFYWKTASDKGLDLNGLGKAGGALSVVMNMVKSPEGKVKLRMDCQWPCRGELDVTKLFKRLPETQWVRLSFPLACFEKAGTDLTKVNSPFVLVANDVMSLVVLDVAVVRNPDASSLVPCR